MRTAVIAVAALVAVAGIAACDAAERRADEVAKLRERAVVGIQAVEAFCTVRDSVVARVERAEPGMERELEEVLLAPVVLDDYCAEFRFHSHDDHEESGPAEGASDTTGHVDR